MKVGSWVKSNLDYGRELVESGMEGARSARSGELQDTDLASELASAAAESWRPALLGAVLGAALGSLSNDRKAGRGAVIGGIFGAAIGLAGGIAWESRHVTGALARGAMKQVSSVRDARWLADNPVDYA